MKTTSRFARAAAVGFAMAAITVPARAADLGGGCCADLEERVAELEATTARKGNRVVSLHVYGQVNKALLIMDDGKNSDAFVVDNAQNTSRIGLRGNALIKPGWSAGYVVEVDINDAPSHIATLTKNGDDPETGQNALVLRQNNFYIESETLGRITVGRENAASAGAYQVNLGHSNSSSSVTVGGATAIQSANGENRYNPDVPGGGIVTLSTLANNFDSAQPGPGGGANNLIRYDSPAIYGFVLSAAWGDNDYADAALRFQQEFAGLRIAGAVAYQWNNQFERVFGVDMNFETFGGSLSVMHVATGLYATFNAAQQDYKDKYLADANMWYVQGGIEQKWLPYGATTVYGEYGQYGDAPMHKGSEAVRWGFGVNQKIDAAEMDVYAQATVWSFNDGAAGYAHTELEDLSTLMVGSRIQF